MKALKITLDHGRIWTAETSSGARAQSSTLEGALTQLVPGGLTEANDYSAVYGALALVMDAIPDSGGSGIARSGQASA